MSIRTIPGKRWSREEKITYAGLIATGQPAARIEPETVGSRQWNTADMTAIVATAPAGTAGTMTFVSDTAVAARTRVDVIQIGVAPAEADETWQVHVAWAHAKIYFTAYIGSYLAFNINGAVSTPCVRFTMTNLDSASATVLAGSVLNYIVVRGPIGIQPTAPTAYLTITGYTAWTFGVPLTGHALNAMALPAATLADGSLGQVETNTAALMALANSVIGKRDTFAVPTDITLSGASTLIGTKVVIGASSGASVALITRDVGNPFPIFTANITGANSVNIHAWKNSFAGTTVYAGTVLNILVL